MLSAAFRQLDQVLRGESTRIESLRQGNIPVSARNLALVVLLLGMWYGTCMGVFGLFHPEGMRLAQLGASTLKVPLLFLLTLIITFPSLYVFNALVGSRLRMLPLLRLLVGALGVNLSVLASLGSIVAFFSLSTSSYHFMVLLNVAVFAVAGFLGLGFLIRTLHRLSVAEARSATSENATLVIQAEEISSPDASVEVSPPDPAKVPDAHAENVPQGTEDPQTASSSLETPPSLPKRAIPGPLESVDEFILQRHVKTVFACWLIVYGLVGAQMGWILRPFIGDPDMPFALFRERNSNFFQAVWDSLVAMLS